MKNFSSSNKTLLRYVLTVVTVISYLRLTSHSKITHLKTVVRVVKFKT